MCHPSGELWRPNGRCSKRLSFRRLRALLYYGDPHTVDMLSCTDLPCVLSVHDPVSPLAAGHHHGVDIKAGRQVTVQPDADRFQRSRAAFISRRLSVFRHSAPAGPADIHLVLDGPGDGCGLRSCQHCLEGSGIGAGPVDSLVVRRPVSPASVVEKHGIVRRQCETVVIGGRGARRSRSLRTCTALFRGWSGGILRRRGAGSVLCRPGARSCTLGTRALALLSRGPVRSDADNRVCRGRSRSKRKHHRSCSEK